MRSGRSVPGWAVWSFMLLFGLWYTCWRGECRVKKFVPYQVISKVSDILKCRKALGSSLADLPVGCDPPLVAYRKVRHGKLRNGLTFVIDPTGGSSSSFSAHLKILTGSLDEEEDQMGMAHFVEHVAVMENGVIVDTGNMMDVRMNAYTTFGSTHYAASGYGSQDLFKVLHALSGVFRSKVREAEVEKQRGIILSEFGMVTDRVSFKLSHQSWTSSNVENHISTNNIIGREEQIRAWSVADLKRFFDQHYQPSNAVLYVTGGESGRAVENEIRSRFNWLRSTPTERRMAKGTLKEIQSRHFPAVVHAWSTLSSPLSDPNAVNVVSRDDVSGFSFEMTAKSPVENVTSLRSFRRLVLKKFSSRALNDRLKKVAEKALFSGKYSSARASFQVFNDLSLGYEVRMLSVKTNNPSEWKAALTAAFREKRLFAKYGLSQTEFDELKENESSFSFESPPDIFDSTAAGHTIVSRDYYRKLFKQQVGDITLEEVNECIKELCSYSLWFEQNSTAPAPNSIFASGPTTTPDLNRVQLMATLLEDADEDVDAEEPGDESPTSFMSDEEITNLARDDGARWINKSKQGKSKDGPTVELRELSNGVKVSISNPTRKKPPPSNLSKMEEETDEDEEKDDEKKLLMNVSWLGGKFVESKTFEESSGTRYPTGSIALGARWMQEGNAFGQWSTEQIRGIYAHHEIFLTISATTRSLDFKFRFRKAQLAIVLQAVRAMMTDLKWDPDAFEKARTELVREYRKNRSSCQQHGIAVLYRTMMGLSRERWTERDLQALDMEEVCRAIQSQMSTQGASLFILGDVEVNEVQEMVRQYIGTVPYAPSELEKVSLAPLAIQAMRQDLTEFSTGDEVGAVVYVAGAMPSLWGFNADGTHAILKDGKPLKSPSTVINTSAYARRQNALFAYAAIPIAIEVISKRMFLEVRETANLAYHAQFDHFSSYDEHQKGGVYYAKAWVEPENAHKALEVMKKTLSDLQRRSFLRRGFKISDQEFQSAKQQVTRRMAFNYLNTLQRLHDPENVLLTESFVSDWASMASAVTVQDMYVVLKTFDFDAAGMFTCVCISDPQQDFWVQGGNWSPRSIGESLSSA